MIRDETQLQELSSTVSAGFLPGEVVFAVGHLVRGEKLDGSQRDTIADAELLLKAAASPPPISTDPAGLQQLAAADSALDALHAARIHAPDKDIQAYLSRLVAVLAAA